MAQKKICIVTPSYLTSSPRTVKEADALWQAGFDVRVVFSQGSLEYVRGFDALLLKEKPWRYSIIGWSSLRKKERMLYWKSRLHHYFARKFSFLGCLRLAAYAESRVYGELARVAAEEKADLYIGHYPAGLVAADYAALRWKTKLGYDVEDLHSEEQPAGRKGERQTERIKLIESHYLPHCSYISCVSELVADEMVKRYNINYPTVIHNVFPWSLRGRLDAKFQDRRGPSLSLYWYSQVIGEDRGIQDVIRAAGLLKEKVQIHLRGYLSEEVKNKFLALAKASSVEQSIHFHPVVSPSELLSRAVEHDVGLALEPPVNLRRMLTASNKLFLYLLAGLAVIATDTPGQKLVMSTCPQAGFLYPSGDYRCLAGHLNKLLSEPGLIRSCKQAALEAAEEQWNWESESLRIIDNIRSFCF